MAVKAQNAGIPATYSISPGQFEPCNVSMGEVPTGTWVTGEMLCSPGLARQKSSLAVVDKSLYFEVPSSVSHFLSSSSFNFFPPILVSIKIEKTFSSIAVLFRKVDEWLSAFVEFGLVALKMEFDSFFSAPSICSFHSPSEGFGLDQFLPLINNFS